MKHALLVLALIATQAQAQIIYTDVIPDASYGGTNDSCYLDLDNNGEADFLIIRREDPGYCMSCLIGTHYRVLIYPMSTHVISGFTWLSQQFPQCHQSGQVIGTNLSYSVTNGLMRDASPSGGCPPILVGCTPWPPFSWANYPEGYLGLRFMIAGEIHYGWARLSIPSAAGFTLKDYAYNSVANEPIAAGDDGATTGITSIALRTMQVSPNPFTAALSISLQTGTTGAVLCRVLSLTGQAVITRTVAATSGPSAITLDLASLAPGTYLLEMQVDGERMVRKVVKE
ncbi:MAG: T9SS type A sorting domain-containing protein [Flavobacteriales bacterium]|nr:T9SS type A sorting domain-containing protein [Flavobacteriales bacterium]